MSFQNGRKKKSTEKIVGIAGRKKKEIKLERPPVVKGSLRE